MTDREKTDRALVANIAAALAGLLAPGRLGTLASQAVHDLDVALADLAQRPEPAAFERGLDRLVALRNDLAAHDPEDTVDRARSDWRRGETRMLGAVAFTDWDGTTRKITFDEQMAKLVLIDAYETIEREPNLDQQQALKTLIKQIVDLRVPPLRGPRPGGTQAPPSRPFDPATLRSVHEELRSLIAAHREAGRLVPHAWPLVGEEDAAPEATLRDMGPHEIAWRLIAARVGLARETGWQTVQRWAGLDCEG